jgi:pentatricopeptide repeat domain-containing protein 1
MYNVAINSCGNGKHPKRALELFREMQQIGLEADVIPDSAATHACEKCKHPERRWSSRRVPTKDLEPDVIMYNAAIRSCENCKHPKRALELFGEMQQIGLKADVITYSAATHACEKCEYPERRWSSAA